MKILIASDKFKDALSQEGVNSILRAVVTTLNSEVRTECVALSDGGDGFLQVVESSLPGLEKVYLEVPDPLERPIQAYYLWEEARKTAYIELAVASGLALLAPEERRVLDTTTLGTGELIRHASERGAGRIYVGLGGSATNDGGIGIGSAMGYGFLNHKSELLSPCGRNLCEITRILSPDQTSAAPKVFAVNDVNNPLYGAEGAAVVYARQKGASPSEIAYLDKGLRQLSEVVNRELAKDVAQEKGSGAAGGCAYGLKVFLNAAFINGAEFNLKIRGISSKLQEGAYDLVITGEGSIDDQTGYGKLIAGLSRAAARAQTPVVAFCGVNALKEKTRSDLGLKSIIPVSDPDKSLEYNLKHTKVLLKQKATDFFKDYFSAP